MKMSMRAELPVARAYLNRKPSFIIPVCSKTFKALPLRIGEAFSYVFIRQNPVSTEKVS